MKELTKNVKRKSIQSSTSQNKTRLRIAIQKSGRLNADSMDLFTKCGLEIRASKNSLLCHVENFPVDLLFVRDNDINTLVMDQVCDIGILGENVLLEQNTREKSQNVIEKKLGFSKCRLSIALPEDKKFIGPESLNNLRIATSYPNLLTRYLKINKLNAEIVEISGSVEIAPRLELADAICDLVSTGRTLEENNLQEVDQIMQSEAVLIKNANLPIIKQELLNLLLIRIESVLKAQNSKYIMFHAPKSALVLIKNILPGSETPTIMPLEGFSDKVAVHVVANESVFWVTLEKLKQAGASSILVLPIEKMLE